MLKLLNIQNLVLIESAQIPFEAGFNTITGESGAGKSVVMQALKLIGGAKVDPKLLRHGAEKGYVEALFELAKGSKAFKMLEEAGIDADPAEPLMIRREFTLSQKNRIFINNQLASLNLLKEIGELLFDIASQHASQKLSECDYHRLQLDKWAQLQETVQAFQESWKEEKTLEKALRVWLEDEAKRLREKEVCLMEIEEIEEAKLVSGEDEQLFQEYSQLSTCEERLAKSQETLQLLQGEKSAVLPLLNRARAAIEQIAKLDPSVNGLKKILTDTTLEIEEASYQIRNYTHRIEFNGDRMQFIDERMKQVSKLKKKYGNDILAYCSERKAQLKELEGSDEARELMEKQLNLTREKNQALAEQISSKRKEASQSLEKAITQELHTLNMEKAEFFVQVDAVECSSNGCDRVEFFFRPNPGGKKIGVKDSASGGELSRILLALKTLLTSQEEVSTLVFDEIDANIGGKTASSIAEKLQAIGKCTQVISITHFPQVAEFASHHLRIYKTEQSGHTFSFVEKLSLNTRQDELKRMAGVPS